jgi:MFS family permease
VAPAEDRIAAVTGRTPDRMFFGWKVVATAFAVAVFSWGVGFYGPSVFLHVLHSQRGWPVSVISAAITAHYLVSAAIVIRLPELHRRFGVAAMTRAATGATALGLLGWAFAGAPWQLSGAAIMTGAGFAATSGAAIIAMVSPWFERRRAIALSYALNGASAAGVLFTPLWVLLIDKAGFVVAVAAVGVAMTATIWPLAERFLGPTPETKGVAPDGEASSRSVQARQPQHQARPFRALFRDRRFTTLSTGFALGFFAQIGLVTHLLERLAPVFGGAGAATAVGAAALCAVPGRLLLGSLLGRADRRLAAAGNFAMQACGVGLLALMSSTPTLLIGCALFGLGIGNLVLLPPIIAQAEFEPADIPRVVALVTAINQAVFAFAPFAFGVFYDLTGGYAVPFCAAAVFELTAGAIVLVGREGKCAPTSHNAYP